MVVTCERCKKQFKYPSLLKRHLNKKNACMTNLLNKFVKDDKTCPKCNKKFSSKSSLFCHLKTVDCTAVKSYYPDNPKITQHINYINGNNNVINQNTTVNNVVNNNIHIHIGSNSVIPFNKFTYDKVMDHIISRDDMFELLKMDGMPVAYMRNMHINPRLPQGHCVNIKNKNKNEVNIKDTDGWKIREFTQFILDYLNNLQRVIFLFEDEIKDDPRYKKIKENMKKIDKEITIYIDNVSEDGTIKSENISPNLKIWMKQIKNELLDYSTMLKKTKLKDIRKPAKKKKITNSDESILIDDADVEDLSSDNESIIDEDNEGYKKAKEYEEKFDKQLNMLKTLSKLHADQAKTEIEQKNIVTL